MSDAMEQYADKNKVTMSPITYDRAKEVIVNNHYSHSMPASECHLGFYIDGKLNCVIVMGQSATPQMKFSLPSMNYWELSRLFSFDWGGKNIETICIGMALKYVNRRHKKDVIISFADPSQGHIGCIYQASNWLYCGTSGKTGGFQYFFDSKWQHPRTTVAKYGTREHAAILKLFPCIKYRTVPGKHRYIYLLGSKKKKKEMLANIQYPILPYPKLEQTPDYQSQVNKVLNNVDVQTALASEQLKSADFEDLLV